MVTISHLVKKALQDNSFILEGLAKGLISQAGLAQYLLKDIEKELGSKVKESAIIMAIRRYEEELSSFESKLKKFKFHGELILKTNMVDVNVVKSQSLLNKIRNLYAMVDFERGDVLNIILGNNEIAIITNERYRDKLLEFLHGEKIVVKKTDLVELTISFSSKDFLVTPGIVFTCVRKLAWEDINILEIVSTCNELSFILERDDSMKAYSVLQELFVKHA